MDIFRFQDYRSLIQFRYDMLRAKDNSFCLEQFLKISGINNRDYLQQLFDRRVELSTRLIAGLARSLRFDSTETAYFTALVHYNQCKDLNSRRYFKRQLKKWWKRHSQADSEDNQIYLYMEQI